MFHDCHLKGNITIFDNILGNGPNDHIGIIIKKEQGRIITAEGDFHNRSGIFQRTKEQINGYIRIEDTY